MHHPTNSGYSSQRHNGGADAAAIGLEQMGHKQELKRNFSMISMLGLAFAILNTWTALSVSLSVALPSGGPSAIIWGLLAAGTCNLCLAASLAEFLSSYPTAGGQYHWAAIVSWKRTSRGISYMTGWINVSGWIALSATGGLFSGHIIMNVVTLLRPAFKTQIWHHFVAYVGITLIGCFINAFLARILPLFTKAAFIWSLSGFAIITITILACAAPDYQPGEMVYGSFVNDVGWPDGLAWLLGTLQGAFALTGFDAVAHMIEELPNPEVDGPRVILYAIGIGMVTGFIFLSCLLFCVNNIDNVISSPYGPLLQIFMDATNNPAGSVCLLIFPIVCGLFATTTIMCTSSRMSYAFARDAGMPFSRTLAKVHPTLEVPINALLWTTAWVLAFGCIMWGSSSVINSITSASVVALGITYAIPPTINALRGRSMLPANRPFRLPEPLGWICNLVGVFWSILITVLFLFPPELPATASNMNYCSVAFGVVLLISVLTWLFHGRNHYHGPPVQSILQARLEGAEPDTANNILRESEKPQAETLDG